MSEQVSFLWQCGKCGNSHPEQEIFCTVCAAAEGKQLKNSATLEKAQKTSKIDDAMIGAIQWSLQHAQIKPRELLQKFSVRGYSVQDLTGLRELPLAVLDDVAGSYIGANRLGATGSGLATGLPGGLLGFAAIPADVSAVIYFALRTLSGISQSYSFETQSQAGQAVQLLVFAQACKLETMKIGQRRLENFTLAKFLLKNPEPYAQLARACILQQLGDYLTTDFAKTSWATFLPVVGSVVNSTTNFMFVSDIGKGGRIFYRSLLTDLVPEIVRRVAVPQVKPPALPKVTTIENREVFLQLPGGLLKAFLTYPLVSQPVPLVIVWWSGEAGREIGEWLAEKGFATLVPQEIADAAGLQEILANLSQLAPVFETPNALLNQVGLVAFGENATAALEVLEQPAGNLVRVVLSNPLGPSRKVVTNVPVLLLWSSKNTIVDPGWAEMLRPRNQAALVTAMEYAGVGFAFLDPASPDYNSKIAELARKEMLNWLKELK